MPCNESEEEMQPNAAPKFSTPTKKARNDGAGQVEPDGSEHESESEVTDEFPSDKRRRKWNGRVEYTLIKTWVTGERAEMEDEDIQREMFELAREWMSASKLKKLPGHIAKPTDFALWKQYRRFTKRKTGVDIRLFRCPMHYRCGCSAGIRIQTSPSLIQLDRSGEHHANSHDEDKSKFLKYNQIIAVTDAVAIAPNLSAAELRRNMQISDSPGKKMKADMLRSIRNRVKTAREQLTTTLLSGYAIDDSFGSLTKFAARLDFRRLIDQHNDSEHEFHFDLFEPIIIGSDIQARRDLVHINITSPWFLFNAFRAIGCGWGIQLNGDATFSFCRTAVDMIGMGVNSIGAHNHPLTWSIIPKGGEGSITYDLTFDEVQEAAITFLGIVDCCDQCAFCKALAELRADPDVVKFMKSGKYRSGQLRIDSAQCDNHLGWQKFAREKLGLTANICKNHVLGESLLFNNLEFRIFSDWCVRQA
jgi:hypothetical protein